MSASGLTYLQIINRVLPRLREKTVASNGATTYSAMIGTMVNQIKNEIEVAWQRRARAAGLTTHLHSPVPPSPPRHTAGGGGEKAAASLASRAPTDIQGRPITQTINETEAPPPPRD